MKNRAVILIAVCLAACFACQSEKTGKVLSPPHSESRQDETGTGAAGTGTITLKVTFPGMTSAAAKTAMTESIDTITAYVYEYGEEIARQNMTITDGRYSGRITAPALDDLSVVLVFYDGDIVRYIGKDEDVDVPVNGEAVAEIALEFMGRSVLTPETAIVGDYYTVSWPATFNAVAFEIEESSQPTFIPSTKTEAFSFSYDFSKDIPGTYYYRVRIQTEYGYGPFYSKGVSSITVVPDDGSIVVDGAVPPDEPEVRIIDFDDRTLTEWTYEKNVTDAGTVSFAPGSLRRSMGSRLVFTTAAAPTTDDAKAQSCYFNESADWEKYSVSFDFRMSDVSNYQFFCIVFYNQAVDEILSPTFYPMNGYMVMLGVDGMIQYYTVANGAFLHKSSAFGAERYPDTLYRCNISYIPDTQEGFIGAIRISVDNEEYIIDMQMEDEETVYTGGAFGFVVINRSPTPLSVEVDNIQVTGIVTGNE